MKSFVLTLLLFGLLTGVMVCDYCCVNRTVGELLAMLDRFPDTPGREAALAAEALSAYWAAHAAPFRCSVSAAELSRIEAALTVLALRSTGDSTDEYRCTLALLRLAVSSLGRLRQPIAPVPR